VNAHNSETVLDFYAENAVTVSPAVWRAFRPHRHPRQLEDHRFLVPDWMVKVSDVLLDGDRIAFVGMATATDRNGWFGQVPTEAQLDKELSMTAEVQRPLWWRTAGGNDSCEAAGDPPMALHCRRFL